MPDYLKDWSHFVQLTEQLQRAGIIKSVKDLWWDVRPHPGFGTVEIRVSDIPINFKAILALVALMQALVLKIKKENFYSGTHIQILQSNKWQAARYGLEGVFVDPITYKKLNMKEAINNLCNYVESSLTLLGSSKYIKTIEEILNQGTGTVKQRELYNSSNNFEYMLQYLKEKFYAQ
jgi:carboxylate-amine ligase